MAATARGSIRSTLRDEAKADIDFVRPLHLSPRKLGARWRLQSMLFAAMVLIIPGLLKAGPFLPPGDEALRHDVQLLADAGVLNIPVTTWPLAWADIALALDTPDSDLELGRYAAAALARLRSRLAEEAVTSELVGQLFLAGDSAPRKVRRFAHSPRAEGEAGAALEWTGLRFAVRLETRVVANPDDEKKVRLDGSFAGMVLGNWSISAGEQDQWWGPGHEGSLILSSNARPVPGILFKRQRSLRFKSRWLSWIGPWNASVFAGQLESGRAVPDANLLGARIAFKPTRSLEIGLSRTAQWCGEGRPCGFDSFWNMLIGNDNSGEDDGLSRDEEPGNQLGGVDLRFASRIGGQPFALYGQFIGEDEAGGLPSRFLGQLGVETWGAWGDDGASYRVSAEYSDTACDFPQSDPGFNCAYRNGLYPSGYRYRSESLGHPMDNDGRMLAVSGLLLDGAGRVWAASLRIADLNRGGDPDFLHSVTPDAARYLDIELRHSREIAYGVVQAGVGFESIDPDGDGERQSDPRLFVQWRSR